MESLLEKFDALRARMIDGGELSSIISIVHRFILCMIPLKKGPWGPFLTRRTIAAQAPISFGALRFAEFDTTF